MGSESPMVASSQSEDSFLPKSKLDHTQNKGKQTGNCILGSGGGRVSGRGHGGSQGGGSGSCRSPQQQQQGFAPWGSLHLAHIQHKDRPVDYQLIDNSKMGFLDLVHNTSKPL